MIKRATPPMCSPFGIVARERKLFSNCEFKSYTDDRTRFLVDRGSTEMMLRHLGVQPSRQNRRDRVWVYRLPSEGPRSPKALSRCAIATIS
jgi:hypothetical protein